MKITDEVKASDDELAEEMETFRRHLTTEERALKRHVNDLDAQCNMLRMRANRVGINADPNSLLHMKINFFITYIFEQYGEGLIDQLRFDVKWVEAQMEAWQGVLDGAIKPDGGPQLIVPQGPIADLLKK